MDTTTFALPSLDGYTFHVERGSGDTPGLPSNWISITATDPDGDPIPGFRVGFQGP